MIGRWRSFGSRPVVGGFGPVCKINRDFRNDGAITLGTPDGRVIGPVTESNSAVGILADQGIAQIFTYDPERNQLVVGQPASNRAAAGRLSSPVPPFAAAC